MKKEAKVLQHIERSPLFLLISVIISAVTVFSDYLLLKNMNPWGFILMVPAAVFSFQTLWWLLHPFALIFEDKAEIKQSLIHHKDRYFIDIKRVSTSRQGKFCLVYKDDEVEALNLFGIKPSHVALLRSEIEKALSGNVEVEPLEQSSSLSS